MAKPNTQPLVTKMDIDNLFDTGDANQDQASQEPRQQAGVLITRMSISDLAGALPIDPVEQGRVMYEIASQG